MRIFYFSGTGNSYYAARRIAGEAGESQLTSISEFLKSDDRVVRDTRIVIVSPVYFYCLPPVVERFISEVELENAEYLSVVFTAEFPNGLALAQTQRLFQAKGLQPDSLFYVKMPTNYVIKSKMLAASAIDSLLASADRKLDRIAKVISEGRVSKQRDSSLYSLVVGAKASKERWDREFPSFDARFGSNDLCNGCKTCAANCPAENISVDARPRWNGHCEACLRCINICPKHAIQYGDSTQGRRRYFNPRVTLKELR